MKNKRVSSTLRFKIFLIFLVMAIGLNLIMITISSLYYNSTALEESKRISVGLSNLVASGINGNRIDDWLKERRMDEYKIPEQEIINLMKSNKEIERITVCKMLSSEMQVIFNIDKSLENKGFLSKISYGTELKDIKNDLLYGYMVEPIKYKEGNQRFVSSLTPVKSTIGEVECYVICQLSLDRLNAERGLFTTVLLITMAIATAVVCSAYFYLTRTLASPLSKIDTSLQRFADDNRSGERTKEVLSNEKQNRISIISDMNNNFIDLINDVHDKSDKVDDISSDIIKNVSNMVNQRNIKDTSNTDAIESYTLVICDNLRRNRKYRKELTDVMIDAIITSIPLYDLGEIWVSDDILNKSGKLTDEEFESMKRHVERGSEIVSEIMTNMHDEFYVEVAKQVAQYHHERWDGSGYMEHLKGKKIPLPARIIAVADVFNALVSNKAYRDGMSIDDAFTIIKNGRGKLFDKSIVNAFLDGENSIRKIAMRYSGNKN